MSNLIDTHAHLNFPDYSGDLDEVIKRSIAAGVGKIVCASSSVDTSRKSIEVANKYPGIVFAVCGIHPQQTDPKNSDSLEKQIDQIGKLLTDKSVVAVGECGLDYSPAPPGEKGRGRENQFFLFQKQIELANKYELPLIIHARKAVDDVIEILRKYPKSRGVFHCYYGGKRRIQQVLDLGFYFGFDGNLTYDPGLQNVAELIDIDRIVLETDSPDLTPVPYRGSRNEPANVRIVAQELARLKGIDFEKASEITSNNAAALFGL